MSRTVNYASDAIAVAYFDYDDREGFDWEELEDDIVNRLQESWKSFTSCRYWLDNEVLMIAENDLAYVAISEYCGLCSLSLVPKSYEDDYHDFVSELGPHWCNQIKDKFVEKFSTLRKVATFSNGEAVYERVQD